MKRWWVMPNPRDSGSGSWMTGDEIVEWLRTIGPVVVEDGPRAGLNIWKTDNPLRAPDWWAQADMGQ